MVSKSKSKQLLGASKNNHVDKVKELLDTGCIDVNFADMDGCTPLSWACVCGFTQIIELLLESGADTAIYDIVERTPLFYASCNIRNDNFYIVKLLLDKGADINMYDYYGETCLDYQKKKWKYAKVQELIITKQSHNIKFFDDKIGIIPFLKEKYKEIIELYEMGLL